ncbi:MAG: DUF389 domain-containing protein [Actinomycetia bacterium]|nr:DUF389 domain-containing protein [Actinomycetes bacterium]
MNTRVKDAEADWINPATVRGAAFIAGGVFILAVPEASTRLLGIALSVALVVFGAIDLWGAVRTKPITWTSVALGIASIAGGLALLLLPEVAFDVLARLFAVLLAIRGATTVFEAIRHRRTSDDWTFHVVRGGFGIAAAVIIFVLPDAIATALLLSIAALALIAGGIMLSYGLSHKGADTLGAVAIGGYVKRWLGERDVGDEMRQEVIDNLYFEPPGSTAKQVGFWVLLVLSTTIATLAILADSTAVVIGAMLVAPLMTPILGVSAGIVNGWMGRVSKAFLTVAGGVSLSILTAWIVASWAPHFVPIAANSQVISRISPTLLDMMIAVAAGAAGAYATVDKRVSASITGVAIAVALVPPLGVVGVTLTAGAYSAAFGAFLLFMTNLVSIILAASVVFVLTGFAVIGKLRENKERMKTVFVTVLLGAMIILVPLAFTSEGILTSASRQTLARDATEAWLAESESLELNRVEVDGDKVVVVVTGEGTIPVIKLLNADLSEAFGIPATAEVVFFPSTLLTAENQP